MDQAEYIIKLRTIAKAAQELYYTAPPVCSDCAISEAQANRYIAALSDLHDAMEDANLLEEQQAQA